MNGVLRQVQRVTQGDVTGGQLDLRNERLFRAGREHYGAAPEDLQLELAEEASVIVKEADIRSAGGRDVAGNGGGEKSLAVDESKVVDLAWFQVVVGDPRLDVRACDLQQFVLRNAKKSAHAIQVI